MKYKWKQDPGVIIMEGTEMAQFVLTGYDTVGIEVNYVAGLYLFYPIQLYVSI